MHSHLQANSRTGITSEHRVLAQDGYAIHYYTTGNPAKEALLFLHPAFADHRCFAQQLAPFSQNYFVITVDLMGHGQSQVLKSEDRLDASAGHLRAILQAERCRSAHICGVSMGSLIGQHFALTYPDQVLSLTVLGGYDLNSDNKALRKAQQKEFYKWMLKAIFSMEAFRRYTARVAASKREEQEKLYQMTKCFTRKSFIVMSGLGKIVKPGTPPARTYPLLIAAGDKDLPIVREQSELWHRQEPDSSFAVIEGAGHCANMDNAPCFNEVLLRFLAEKGLRPIA